MHSIKIVGLLFFILLLIVFVTERNVIDKVSLNVGNTFFNKAISPEQPSINARSKFLAQSAALFEGLASQQASISEHTFTAANCSYQHAFALGEAYRRQQNYLQAAHWFNQVATTAPSLSDAEVSIPTWLNIHEDGSVSIDWTNAEWRYSEVTIPSALTAVSSNGNQLDFSYQTEPGQRAKAEYTLKNPRVDSYWNTIYLKARIKEGTSFTFRIRDEDAEYTPVHQHLGNGEWEEFIVPLNKPLEFINIVLGTGDPDNERVEYGIDIEQITFVADNNSNVCK